MKRLALLVGLVAALAVPAAAAAHPLGNFTVNRFSGIELSGDRVYVKYVLDMFMGLQRLRVLLAEAGYESA